MIKFRIGKDHNGVLQGVPKNILTLLHPSNKVIDYFVACFEIDGFLSLE